MAAQGDKGRQYDNCKIAIKFRPLLLTFNCSFEIIQRNVAILW